VRPPPAASKLIRSGCSSTLLFELKLPDMPRPGKQPHDGLEFFVGERVVGQPHFEYLLKFAQPQQREAFIH